MKVGESPSHDENTRGDDRSINLIVCRSVVYLGVSFVTLCSTSSFVISLPYVACKSPLRFMWFDLIDLEKWHFGVSSLIVGRFACENMSLMTIHYI